MLYRCCCYAPQTDAYLEQLTDVIPEADTITQTDAFIERPPTPQFVPAKTGTDATTQIEQGAGRTGSCSQEAQQADHPQFPRSYLLAALSCC
jgi:Radial spoke protein 3